MEIKCYIAESCSSREALLDNLEQALARAGKERDGYRLLDEEEAAELNLKGSPTVLVNGRDIAAAGTESGSG
jgi:hypothetical protein